MITKSKKQIGTVQAIWQYVVKSMNGVKLDQATSLRVAFLVIALILYLISKIIKLQVLSFQKKWSKLLELSATFVKQPKKGDQFPPVRNTSSKGLDVLNTDNNVDDLLSDYVGRAVKLSSLRPNTVNLERLDPLEQDDETILDIGDLMLKNKYSDYADVHFLLPQEYNNF